MDSRDLLETGWGLSLAGLGWVGSESGSGSGSWRGGGRGSGKYWVSESPVDPESVVVHGGQARGCPGGVLGTVAWRPRS